MGRDKVENEDLIKYGTDRDVWFHVDKLSSAHVYVRLPDSEEEEQGSSSYGWENMPEGLVRDCAQLTKVSKKSVAEGSEVEQGVTMKKRGWFGKVEKREARGVITT